MITSTTIHLSTALPPMSIHGFGPDGALLVIMSGWPNCQHELGADEDDASVVRWEVGEDVGRRIAAIAMWAEMGFRTAGKS